MELKSAHQKLLHTLPGTSDFPVTNVFFCIFGYNHRTL